MSRFIQGNCVHIMSGFPDNAVDFILTDPPYLVGFRDRQGRTIAGDKTDEWLQPACHEMYRVLKKDTLMVELLRLEPRRSLYGCLEKCGIQRCRPPGVYQNLHIEGRIRGLSPRMRLHPCKRPSTSATKPAAGRAGLEIQRQPAPPYRKTRNQPATADRVLHTSRRDCARPLCRQWLHLRGRPPGWPSLHRY